MTSSGTTPKHLFLEKLAELKATKDRSALRLFNDFTKKNNKPEVFFTSYELQKWHEENGGFLLAIHHTETNTILNVSIPEGFPFSSPVITKNQIVLNSKWWAGRRLLEYIETSRYIDATRKNILIGATNTIAHDVLNAIGSGYDMVVDYREIRAGKDVCLKGVKADFTKPKFWEKVFAGFRCHFPDCQIGRIAFDWSVYKFVWQHAKNFYRGIQLHDGLIDKHTSLFVPYGAEYIPGHVYNVGGNSYLHHYEDTHYLGWFKLSPLVNQIVYTPSMKRKEHFLREFKYLMVDLPTTGGKKIHKVPLNQEEIIAHNSQIFETYGFRYVTYHEQMMYPVNRQDNMQHEIKSFYELHFK